MPLTPSRALVLKKLCDTFPDAGAAKNALHSLKHYQGSSPAETYAVHLAILKLSGGELWRLREYVKIAKKGDPRDVIYPAQSPEQTAYTDKVLPLHVRRLKVRPLSLAKEAAMQRRDQAQWSKWLESSGA